VLEEVLKNGVHLETSSAFDIAIIQSLIREKKIGKDIFIVCNGYKRPQYIDNICHLINDGFTNVIPVLDNMFELPQYEKKIKGKKKVKLGIRIAAEEEPNFEFYTSRLGIRYDAIKDYYLKTIKKNPKFSLKMLHFFINTGIRDTAYYWSELNKSINVYCELKKVCPELDSLDIGGGFPMRKSLDFEYDYEYMAEQIIKQIKSACRQHGVTEPNIFTEFGSFTVAESGATLFSIIDKKQQNDNELWYMIDSSFITTLPDTWGIKQRFILLAINKWNKDYNRVNIGGLTCDSDDYYNVESHVNQVFLPKNEDKNEPLYIGFFHTGAYQESIGGYGGLQHCLIPAPKHVIIDRHEDGEISTRLFAKEQSSKSMLKILGY
jgi:arginine decarboxylase